MPINNLDFIFLVFYEENKEENHQCLERIKYSPIVLVKEVPELLIAIVTVHGVFVL